MAIHILAIALLYLAAHIAFQLHSWIVFGVLASMVLYVWVD